MAMVAGNIDGHIIPMTQEDSQQFINIYNEDYLNQEVMTRLITNTIEINKEHIWQDALKDYGLIK